jgi:hypothetical protein
MEIFFGPKMVALCSFRSVVTRLLVGAPRAPPKAGVESLPGPAEEAAPGCCASQFQSESPPIQTSDESPGSSLLVSETFQISHYP